MKKCFYIIVVGLFSTFISHSQSIDSLVAKGDDFRSNGFTELAIKEYQKALGINENSSIAGYNLAYTYLLSGRYDLTIKYCNRIIKGGSEKVLDAYVLKGSALDYMGKHNKSIRMYRRAIKSYPSSYLLYYNLGICYHNKNNLDNAEFQYVKSIEVDKLQASSYYMLGILLNEKGERAKSMLSLYFFLLLEPNTERSIEAIKLLISEWKQNVKIESSGNPSIQATQKIGKMNQSRNALDIEISTIYARNFKLNQQKSTDCELFILSTMSLFNYLIDFQHQDGSESWINQNLNFFRDIALADQTEAFSYYISFTCDDAAINGWLETNRNKIELFSKWMNERLMVLPKK